MAISAVAAITLVALAGCGASASNGGESSFSAPTTYPVVTTPFNGQSTATPASSSSAAANFDFADSQGDAVTLSMSFGAPQTYGGDWAYADAAAVCMPNMLDDRAELTITVTLTSRLAGTVSASLTSNDQAIGYVNVYSSGPSCDFGTDTPAMGGANWSNLDPNTPATWQIYIVYPAVLTPADPTLDPTQPVTTGFFFPSVTVDGQGDLSSSSGPRVITCPDATGPVGFAAVGAAPPPGTVPSASAISCATFS
jgi:hypothetical protein